MRPSVELRSALLTIGNAAVGVGLGMSVLGAAFVISQFAAGQGSVTLATPAPSASSLVLVTTTTPPPSTPTPSFAPTSSPPPTDPPATATPTPSPTPPSETVAIAPYTSGGRRYAALRAPVGHVYVAPIAGTVRVQTYQLIDGEVRVGSFVPSLPFFPYITIESIDVLQTRAIVRISRKDIGADGKTYPFAQTLTLVKEPSGWKITSLGR